MSQPITQQLRSPEAKHEVKYQKVFRDTRTIGQKLREFFRKGDNLLAINSLLIVLMFMKPALSWMAVIWLPMMVTIVITHDSKSLPFNLPASSLPNVVDSKDPKPGRKKFYTSRGMIFLGNCMRSGQELWMSFSSFLRHAIYFGTTGAGKTEALGSLVAAFLAHSGGAIFSDAKATPKLGWQLLTLAVYFGRIEDFRAFNFLTGAISANRDPATRLSNTMAPYAAGGHDSLTQLTLGMLSDSGPNDANAYFKDRAVGLISALMPAMCELRDQSIIQLAPSTIATYMGFIEFFKLSESPYISGKSRESLKRYMRSLTGYKEGQPPDKQNDEVRRAFGQAQSYFTRAFASMSDGYGHIFESGMGEIDYRDIIFNDRIMVNLLPTMEKSAVEVQNLARMNLAGQRIAMSIGLGTDFEGTREEVIEALPTASKRPSLIVNDEFAFMAVKDYSVTAAQCRGLNFAIVTAGQEYAGIERALDKEAAQFISNSRFKYIMTTEDVSSTLDLVKKLAGEMLVHRTSGAERKQELSMNMYRDSRNVQLERVSRIDPADLKVLTEGEGFGIYQDNIVLTRHFHHGIDEDEMIHEGVILRMAQTKLPTRGFAAKLVDPSYRYVQCEARIWLDHAQTGESAANKQFQTPPKLLRPAFELLAQNREALTPNQVGKALFGALSHLRSGTKTPAPATPPDGGLARESGSRGGTSPGGVGPAAGGPLGCGSGDFGPATPTSPPSVKSSSLEVPPKAPQEVSPAPSQRQGDLATESEKALAAMLGTPPPPVQGTPMGHPKVTPEGKTGSLADEPPLDATAEELESPEEREAAGIGEDPFSQGLQAFTGSAQSSDAPDPIAMEGVEAGVERIERALGAPPETATTTAKETVAIIAAALKYPTVTPGKKKTDEKTVNSLLRNWITENVGDDE